MHAPARTTHFASAYFDPRVTQSQKIHTPRFIMALLTGLLVTPIQLSMQGYSVGN